MAGGRARLGGSRRRRRGGCRRIDPAGMDPPVQAVGRLRIHGVSMQNEAPEGRLDVGARAAEPVVKVEVPEGGIEVVAPQQIDHAPPEPDAFRIARRAGHGPLGLGEFVDLLLSLLAGVGRRGRRLFARLGRAVLGERRRDEEGAKKGQRDA